MAVSKLWAVKARLGDVLNYAANQEKTAKSKSKYSMADYLSLRDVISYAKNGVKTEQELFCEGINCNPTCAREQFITVKEQFGKVDGIQAYHGYLSFKDQDITPELAQKIGMEYAERVWGERYQVLVTTHLNTEHLHCHFVVNSVSFVDGKRCHDETSWFRFHHIADEICKKYGLHVIEKSERTSEPYYSYVQNIDGKPTRYNLARHAINEAISLSTNLKDFQYYMNRMGYLLDLSQNHKYWTITPKGYKKAIRMYRLGEDYTNEVILSRLEANRNDRNFSPNYSCPEKKKQYDLQTRKDKIKKKGGLYGLYLYYCYLLGYFSKDKKHSNLKTHVLLRDDLLYLDKISKEMRLLGKMNIETREQLLDYKKHLNDKIEYLIKKRSEFRNKIRIVGITQEEKDEYKEHIHILTCAIKKCRKEIDLCDDIEARSEQMESKVKTIEAEQENTITRRER